MSTKKMKRLPYGNSNFEKLITENYAYVDKTQYIELLENEANSNQFFIRPRKFGKSLFFSILSCYYNINQADKFEQLFGELYIGRHPTPRRNSYAVMQFDFSGVDTTSEENFKVSFSDRVQDSVRIFIHSYQNLFPDFELFVQKIENERRGISAMQIAYELAQLSGVKLFILIDEYDHFANNLIAIGKQSGDDAYRHAVRANGLVRNFYEILKIGSKSVVDRIFITGISPVMMDDLTSGFNIADNLTLKLKYNEMLGFTQMEVEYLMQETGVASGLIQMNMETYYDGYLFHENGEHRIYNPSMILYYFNQILEEGSFPKKLIDDNLKTDYGRLQRLIQHERNREQLIQIAKEGGVDAEIITKFSIDRLDDDRYFVSLLFYMGLLTVDAAGRLITRLRIPNYSIQTIYWEYIMEMIAQTSPVALVNQSAINKAIQKLATEGNAGDFLEHVSRNIFSRLSNRDLEHFDEKYIKIMLLACLFQSPVYVPRSEYEVQDGFVDVYLKRHPRQSSVRYEWLWELKYLKTSERKTLPQVRQKAQEQILRYQRDHEMGDREDLKKAAIIFIGKKEFVLIEG
jgi:hypothetical protein